MSLDFHCGDIEDFEAKCKTEDGQWNRVVNHLTWGAFVGVYLQKITEDNVEEWQWRIRFLKNINRPWMQDGFIDEQIIPQYVGFDTNCFPSKTRKQFVKHYMDSLVAECDRDRARSIGI